MRPNTPLPMVTWSWFRRSKRYLQTSHAWRGCDRRKGRSAYQHIHVQCGGQAAIFTVANCQLSLSLSLSLYDHPVSLQIKHVLPDLVFHSDLLGMSFDSCLATQTESGSPHNPCRQYTLTFLTHLELANLGPWVKTPYPQ